jgi:hypothetical protein
MPLARNCLRASSVFPDPTIFLRHLNVGNSGGGDDGGGNNTGVRRTNRMKGHNSSHSTGTGGSSKSGTGSNSHMGNTHNTQGIRSLFRPKRQRQNAAGERKPVPRPPSQLREVFSLFFLLLIKQELEGKVFGFIRVEEPRDIP